LGIVIAPLSSPPKKLFCANADTTIDDGWLGCAPPLRDTLTVVVLVLPILFWYWYLETETV